MSVYYVKARQGSKAEGPLSSAQLRALAASGRIAPDHLVSKDRTKWYLARNIRDLPLPQGVQCGTGPEVGPRGTSASSPRSLGRIIAGVGLIGIALGAVLICWWTTTESDGEEDGWLQMLDNGRGGRGSFVSSQDGATYEGSFSTDYGHDAEGHINLRTKALTLTTCSSGEVRVFATTSHYEDGVETKIVDTTPTRVITWVPDELGGGGSKSIQRLDAAHHWFAIASVLAGACLVAAVLLLQPWRWLRRTSEGASATAPAGGNVPAVHVSRPSQHEKAELSPGR